MTFLRSIYFDWSKHRFLKWISRKLHLVKSNWMWKKMNQPMSTKPHKMKTPNQRQVNVFTKFTFFNRFFIILKFFFCIKCYCFYHKILIITKISIKLMLKCSLTNEAISNVFKFLFLFFEQVLVPSGSKPRIHWTMQLKHWNWLKI